MRSGAVLFLLVALGYAVGSQLAFSWFGADGLGASFFPAAGVTLAALLLVPRRRWPVVLAAAGLAELTVDLYHDLALLPTLGYVAANLTQPLVGALLLGALVSRVDLSRTRDLAAFIACVVVAAPAVGGIIGASSFVLLDGGDGWARFAAEWWVGDGLGVLVVAGAILSLWARPAARLTPATVGTALLLGGAAVLATAAVFQLEHFGLVYVPVVLLAVLAFRVGTRGVALTGAAMAFVAAEATAEGSRYWDALDIAPQTGLLYLQLALGVVIATALALAAEIAQRERTGLELARAESERAVALDRAKLMDSEQRARVQAESLGRSAAALARASRSACSSARLPSSPGRSSCRASAGGSRRSSRVRRRSRSATGPAETNPGRARAPRRRLRPGRGRPAFGRIARGCIHPAWRPSSPSSRVT